MDFWRTGGCAGFLVGREAAQRLVSLGRGTVPFTRASSSLRGRPGFAHFAATKSGLHAMAQSMAREYGLLGIHVAHEVIDGDTLRSVFPAMVERFGEGGLLDPDAIAEIYWHLHVQPESAWAQEIELRPFKESF